MTNNERIAKRFQFDLEMDIFKDTSYINSIRTYYFKISNKKEVELMDFVLGKLLHFENFYEKRYKDKVSSESLFEDGREYVVLSIVILDNDKKIYNFSKYTDEYFNELPDYIKEVEIEEWQIMKE